MLTQCVMNSVLILGAGYTGKKLAERGRSGKYVEKIFETSRSNGGIQFELQKQSTWKNLPPVDGCFWMFPAVPLMEVKSFLDECGATLGRIVVVGSSSGFLVKEPNQE